MNRLRMTGEAAWSPVRRTALPNPNSGIDAVRMRDGAIALVYNHTKHGRTPLNLTFSTDNGNTWGTPTSSRSPGRVLIPCGHSIRGWETSYHLYLEAIAYKARGY